MQLLRVANGCRQVFIKLFHYFHSVAGEIVAAQLDGLSQNGAQSNRFALHGALPRKAEQVLHDMFCPLRLLQNDFERFVRRCRNFGVFQQKVRESEDCGQWIVHFMRHAGHQAADCSHPLRVREFCLQQSRIRNVRHHNHDAVHGGRCCGRHQPRTGDQRRPRLSRPAWRWVRLSVSPNATVFPIENR